MVLPSNLEHRVKQGNGSTPAQDQIHVALSPDCVGPSKQSSEKGNQASAARWLAVHAMSESTDDSSAIFECEAIGMDGKPLIDTFQSSGSAASKSFDAESSIGNQRSTRDAANEMGDSHQSLALLRTAEHAAKACIVVEHGKGSSANRDPWPKQGESPGSGLPPVDGFRVAADVAGVGANQETPTFHETASLLQTQASTGLHASSQVKAASEAAMRSLGRA